MTPLTRQKITFGEMRAGGIRLSDIEHQFICRGVQADVRPNFDWEQSVQDHSMTNCWPHHGEREGVNLRGRF